MPKIPYSSQFCNWLPKHETNSNGEEFKTIGDRVWNSLISDFVLVSNFELRISCLRQCVYALFLDNCLPYDDANEFGSGPTLGADAKVSGGVRRAIVEDPGYGGSGERGVSAGADRGSEGGPGAGEIAQ